MRRLSKKMSENTCSRARDLRRAGAALLIMACFTLMGCDISKAQQYSDVSIGNIHGVRIRVPNKYVLGRVLYDGEGAVDAPHIKTASYANNITSIGYTINLAKRRVYDPDIDKKEIGSTVGLTAMQNWLYSSISPAVGKPDKHKEWKIFQSEIHRNGSNSYETTNGPADLIHAQESRSGPHWEQAFAHIFYNYTDDVRITCDEDRMKVPPYTKMSSCREAFSRPDGLLLFSVFLDMDQISDWRAIRSIALSFSSSIMLQN